jgi:ubiquinone/menaquinone biosynthesis C-methylase UbiE
MSASIESRRQEATLEAYESWAQTYDAEPHNPLMSGEQRTMLALWPAMQDRRVLDLASGSGRYAALAAGSGAREVVALDFSAGMLARLSGARRVRANMMRLPFSHATFDVVIAGLAVGHAEDLRRWLDEIARVLTPGGVALYSDFHPAAAQAGLTRSFVDSDGRQRSVPHRRFDLDEHRRALAAAGLTLEAMREVRVGIDFDEEFPGASEFRTRWWGLPLILVVRARR